MIRVLGIDSGITGAMCLLTEGAGLNGLPGAEFHDIPVYSHGERKRVDIRELARLMDALHPTHTYIEDLWAQLGQGIISAGKMMETYGIVTACAVLYTPENCVYPVSPQKWKNRFKLSSNKDQSRGVLMRMIPDTIPWLKRVGDHNRAEAGLIALYGAERQAMIDLR